MLFIKNKLWYLKAKWNLRSEKGQAMVEYGLLVALIAIVVVAALVIFGPKLRDIFTDAGNKLTPPAAGS